jgi:hypothetical protein
LRRAGRRSSVGRAATGWTPPRDRRSQKPRLWHPTDGGSTPSSARCTQCCQAPADMPQFTQNVAGEGRFHALSQRFPR